eukprot:m.216195 g.216195  ORF g.216195 m.216195 type:complete len:611 (-) comp16982_c0_seq1:63-1895(-)
MQHIARFLTAITIACMLVCDGCLPSFHVSSTKGHRLSKEAVHRHLVCNHEKSENKHNCYSMLEDDPSNAVSLDQHVWGPDFNATDFRERARQMFSFAYDNYMTNAFPHDELDPIHCKGRSSDPDRTNININDVLGNFSLTLIDTLDTLALMGNTTEFWRAVHLVIDTVDFDKDSNVQVFETNIRVLGGLLSAHLLATHPSFHLAHQDYHGELLLLARDLATRLLPAFDATSSGLPYPRVNLRHGVPTHPFWRNDTNTAAVGTLLLEFGTLSRLIDDPTFEGAARRALQTLWSYRSERTLLLGNTIDVHSGRWINTMSGFGAGIDSFFEYLLKASILFCDRNLASMFQTAFTAALRMCQLPGLPLYGQVDMYAGHLMAPWVDSLQAFLPGIKVLSGDVMGAVVDHEVVYAIWRKYGALPERFNFRLKRPDIATYPLRPEFIESTYLLYRATGHKYYQRIGAELLLDLEHHAKVRCGYATIHDVTKMSHEDRMESFFLSETLKYLYLLFDDDNVLHSSDVAAHVLTTEGHIMLLTDEVRRNYSGEELWPSFAANDLEPHEFDTPHTRYIDMDEQLKPPLNDQDICLPLDWQQAIVHPLHPEQLHFIKNLIGL